MATAALKKSDETRARILEAALSTFREHGFERATMRDIAAAAGVAVGAAYYYFDSKDAIVMAYYERAQEEMRPALASRLLASRSLETRLQAIIQHKLDYFLPNRKLLGALTAHTDPEHPLSPFSEETRPIREQDLVFFARAVEESKVKLPPRIHPYLPRLLWLYQMGILLFWVYDRSEAQQRTRLLFEKTLKMIVVTVRLAGLPLLRPLHRLAGELLEVIYGSDPL